MKRIRTVLPALLVLACVLTGCAANSASSAPAASSTAASASAAQSSAAPADSAAASDSASDTVNLMDLYTVTDPADVSYDRRVVLYKPLIESDDHYADGCRDTFTVLYGLNGKGVYMYSVEIYETAEQAQAYRDAADNGEVDGNVYITTSDAAFFTAMESFVPDFDTWVNNMTASGMMDIS